MVEEEIRHYKMIFIGDPKAEKSSILYRFYNNKYEKDYQATIGLDFLSKRVIIKGERIDLLLYDTAGQERFRSLFPMYIRDANIILLVYDITQKDTFVHIKDWLKEFSNLCKDSILVLIGNKLDLEDKRKVTKKEAEEFAIENKLLFGEVSAKIGKGMNELFNSIIYPEMAKKFKIGKNTNNSYDNNLINENQKLNDELNIYKKENERLKIENENLNKQNNLLNNNIIELNIELIKNKKIISNFNNNIQKHGNNNVINNLNELIKIKEKEIILKNVVIYTDGASRGNPGPGGYGAVLQYIDPSGGLHEKEMSEGFRLTTNNRMELLGVITGLEALKFPCEVDIYSDSRYVVDAFEKKWVDGWISKGWKRGKDDPVKNVDLWKRLLKAMKGHEVHFHWVKGHDGHPENERCDLLATRAADGSDLHVDPGFDA